MDVFSDRIFTFDFDEFLTWERSVGIESEQTQLSQGRGQLSAAFATLGELVVWRHRSSARMLCEYSIPEDMVELCICRHPAPTFWCDQQFSGTTLVVHCDGQSYRAIIPAEGVSYGCLFPLTSALEWGLISRQQHSLATSRKLAVAPAADRQVDGLLSHLDSVLDEQSQLTALDQPLHAHDAILSSWQQVIDQCLAAWRTTMTVVTKNDLEVVENFLELIDRRPNEVFTAGQIASELNITRRTLERKFRRHLGVSPYQYLLTRRLHLARRILKTGNTSVLTACSRTGFENTSRFAMLYSRQFGELPSQTKGLASY